MKDEPNKQSLRGREISRRSYQQVLSRLSERRREVMEALIEHGPGTANEISGWLPPTDLCHRNIRSRLAELTELCLVVPVGTVVDPVSGYQAIRYRAVEPGETPPSPGVDSRPRRAIRARLEAENARLRAENAVLKSKLSSTRKLMSNTVEQENSEPEERDPADRPQRRRLAAEDEPPRRREPLPDPNDADEPDEPPPPRRHIVDEAEDAPPPRRRAADDDPDAHGPHEREEDPDAGRLHEREEDPEARHPPEREEDPDEAPPVEQQSETRDAIMERLRIQTKLMANLNEAYALLTNCCPLGDHGKALAKAIEEYMD